MPNGAATHSSSNRTPFPTNEPTLTANGHEDLKANRRFTQIRWVAPFKSREFGQGWALASAIAQGYRQKMNQRHPEIYNRSFRMKAIEADIICVYLRFVLVFSAIRVNSCPFAVAVNSCPFAVVF